MSHHRKFVTLGERQLHYRHAGEGPALVLLHSCPKSSIEQAPLVERLSGQFSVFAFDIPGYGDSDPVPVERPEIADFAVDLAAALDQLGIGSCAMYGRHTGGLIALEFGDRFPDRLASAIFDGFPLFSDDEKRRFLSGYLQPLIPLWDGLHLPGLWARMRENYLFFPWNEGPDPTHRNDLSMPPASQMHATAVDILKVMDRWRVGYASAFRYRPQAALRRVNTPALIMARRDDLLYPHLQRLPELPKSIAIEPHTYDVEAWVDHIERFFSQNGGGMTTPQPPPTKPVCGKPWSTILEVDGMSLRLRRSGSGKGDFLCLHDIPGSSGLEETLIRGLPGNVIVPDLPGVGLSSSDDLTAEKLVDTLCAFALRHFRPDLTLVARGLSAGLGLKLAACLENVGRLVLIRPLFASSQVADFATRYVAAAAADDEGTYLTKIWYAARDNELYWPWFERRREGIRQGERRLEAAYLNAKVVAMAENMAGYADLVHAVAQIDPGDGPALAASVSGTILFDVDPIGRAMAENANKYLHNHAELIPVGPSDEEEIERLSVVFPI